jgi:hypothetical protein
LIMLGHALKWFQALAALLLLAGMPYAEHSGAEGQALSQIGKDGAKTVLVHRQRPDTVLSKGQPDRFDPGADPDAALAPNPAAVARASVAHACAIEADVPRLPRFCGASARAPPSA